MKKSNKWILGVAATVFVAMVPYQVMTQQAVAQSTKTWSEQFQIQNTTSRPLFLIFSDSQWKNSSSVIPGFNENTFYSLQVTAPATVKLEFWYFPSKSPSEKTLLCTYTIKTTYIGGKYSYVTLSIISAEPAVGTTTCGRSDMAVRIVSAVSL